MEPDILVGREQPGEFRPDNTDNVTKHREQNQSSIESKHETRSTGAPNGELEAVESSQFCVGFLQAESDQRRR